MSTQRQPEQSLSPEETSDIEVISSTDKGLEPNAGALPSTTQHPMRRTLSTASTVSSASLISSMEERSPPSLELPIFRDTWSSMFAHASPRSSGSQDWDGVTLSQLEEQVSRHLSIVENRIPPPLNLEQLVHPLLRIPVGEIASDGPMPSSTQEVVSTDMLEFSSFA